MRRYLDRVLVREPRDPSHHLSEYQDDVWLFFPNCWHLKDWVRSDLLIEPDGKARNTAAVEASRMLAIANDTATAAKHLELRGARG